MLESYINGWYFHKFNNYFFYPFIGDFTLFFIDDFTHGCGHWFGRFLLIYRWFYQFFAWWTWSLVWSPWLAWSNAQKFSSGGAGRPSHGEMIKKISNFDLGAGLGTRTSGWFKLATRLTYPFITPVNVDQIKAIFEE